MEVTSTTATSGMYTTETVGNQDLGQTEFLQLLVAQLENQDPLQPMDNTEFVAQLAQFSNVEQLVAVNEGINILGLQQLSMSNAQAASLIGTKVEVNSDSFTVNASDTEIGAAFSLDGDASEITVQIRDSDGEVVRTLELGSQAEGDVSFEWDIRDDNGIKQPTGAYSFDVTATDENGESVSWDPKVTGVVDGVSYDSGYPELVIGDIEVLMSDVLGVYPVSEADGQ